MLFQSAPLPTFDTDPNLIALDRVPSSKIVSLVC